VLELEHVSKFFSRGQGDVIRALEDVSLSVEQASFMTIVGSNGAGKSTLLNVIAGLLPPDRGCVRLDGKDITRLPEHRRARFVGHVYQDPAAGTAPGMSIEENVAMALKRGQRRRLRRGVTRQRRRQFQEYLEIAGLGLEYRLGSLVRTLSGGQRQALALMMATISSPAVLLLDEHTAALDPRAARRIMELTERVVGDGHLTALMVTHNMEQALRYGNRLVMMHEQRIVLDIAHDEKARLTVPDLIERFEHEGGEHFIEPPAASARGPVPEGGCGTGEESHR
jgi:putative tryptophan/tyrosine transport system ATP-binding protein